MFFVVLFCFCCLNNFSWRGLFFFLDSYVYVVLLLMSVFIYGLILFREKNRGIINLSKFLIFVSILYFIPSSVIFWYIFFELSMFPVLVMILGYGYQIEKLGAFNYLLIYTVLCSMPFLFVYFSLDWNFILVYFDSVLSWELVFVISLTFLMKFPVFFLHLWLPKAHVEAPTTASMLLAGLLLKLGTVGFLRIMKSVSYVHVNYYFFISFLGMILGAFSCIFQSDVKSMAAYSSITHISFLLISLLFFTVSGKTGSLLIMVAHGYTSTLIFYFIGEFYNKFNTRIVYYFNSFFCSSSFVSIMFGLVILSNVGMPISLSFFGEFFGVTNAFVLFGAVFFVLLVYFFVSFYYSVFLIVSAFIGKVYIDFNTWFSYFSYNLVFIAYNLFWFCVFF